MNITHRHVGSILVAVLLALSFAFMALAPSISLAQEDELHASIRAALMADPRTANMSEAELNAMVEIIAQQAQEQGITSQDINGEGEPTMGAPLSTAMPMCEMPAFMCELNEAFGFDGSDLKIPIGLGVSSAWLLFIIGMMIHKGMHKPVVPVAPAAAAVVPPAAGPGIY